MLWRRLRLAVATLIVLVCVFHLLGCIIIPGVQKSRRNDMGHQPVTAERLATLRPAETTEADVIKTFGKPTLRLKEGRILAYTWSTSPAFYFTVATCSRNDPERKWGDNQTHWLLLEFNDDQTLRKSRIQHGGRLATTQPADIDHVLD